MLPAEGFLMAELTTDSLRTAADTFFPPVVGVVGGGMDLARSRSLVIQTLAFARLVSLHDLRVDGYACRQQGGDDFIKCLVPRMV